MQVYAFVPHLKILVYIKMSLFCHCMLLEILLQCKVIFLGFF